MNYIKIEELPFIGTIIFNNEEKRNSFNSQMILEIIEAIEYFKTQKKRVIVIRAKKGAKVWSAGVDISELPEPGRDPLSYNDPIERVLREVQLFPAPVIAMVEGSVWGGACDLAFVCDLIVGCETASFAITPAKIGVPYNSSGILHFVNIVGMRIAKEMFFTALPVNANEAYTRGIMNHLVNSEELEGFTYKFAEKIIENSPLAISVIKEQLRILGNSHPMSPEVFEKLQGLRRIAYDSEDYLEGKRAFLEKRKPNFKGK